MRLTRDEKRKISELFRKLGKKGGIARAMKLSPEQKRDIAYRAALKRWVTEVQGQG
ncbi:MAG TPA: hypothetical protein VL155_04735 [Terriglobales bacterium]|jgi:hypothetical protein|nr:hypothetical protein [Terriglobales bacterium]